jgi:anti-sigma B factor antagonist
MKKQKANPANGKDAIGIEGSLTICQVLEWKPKLLDAINQSSQCEIDLSAVNEIDTAGAQLLIYAKKAAHEMRKELHITRHSPAVLEMFELLNLAAYFGDPLVINSSVK